MIPDMGSIGCVCFEITNEMGNETIDSQCKMEFVRVWSFVDVLPISGHHSFETQSVLLDKIPRAIPLSGNHKDEDFFVFLQVVIREFTAGVVLCGWHLRNAPNERCMP